MKVAVYTVPAGEWSRRAPPRAGVVQIRLGEEVLVIGGDADWGEPWSRAGDAGAALLLERETALENLHLVTQLGNLFQRAHPDVPVLLDKGRYLVVDVPPSRAGEIATGETCYALRQLRTDETVFDFRPAFARQAEARAPILALLARLDRTRLEEDLQRLVAFETRFSTSARFGEAVQWARATLDGLGGYATRVEDVLTSSGHSLNIIAERLGEGEGARGVVVVTAHLDSINALEGSAAPAPGADDNGSGSAGLLAMARALAGHRATHDLRFVLFGGEEEGLFGSRQHVTSLVPEERSRILAVVNMDMVATLNTAAPTVLIEGGAGVSDPVIEALVETAGIYTSLAVQTSLNPFNSDHVPFIESGVPAVLTIEGADRANENVHTRSDTLEHIDYDLFLQILTMNLAFVAGAVGEGDAPQLSRATSVR